MTETTTADRGPLTPSRVEPREPSAQGLTEEEAATRLRDHGPNTLVKEAKPSRLQVAALQLRDPMNLMLVVVAGVGIFIGQAGTATVVIGLILLNLVLGTNQEMKARASVEALADLDVPQAKVIRDGRLRLVAAAELVPGDIVPVEAGDVVPADGRILTAATLETQEAALTGESLPVGKSPEPVNGDHVAVGDRSDMLFQNTSVTRGSGTMEVTATGMDTEVGRIASMLTSVKRTRSPLQHELDDLTSKIGVVAWSTLALILLVGLARGLELSELLLLGISMAISAIPTGMPTFVQSMLSMGAQQLANAKAVVRNLSDVETLGATSQINTDKTGTLTLNEMTVRALFNGGEWYAVDGEGYATSGTVRGVAGAPVTDFLPLAYVSALASDASVSAHGQVVGDPTEAAVVVLAEKLGVSVDETRAAYPRLATVPFDSAYKFMATFHRLPYGGAQRVVGLVKGAPDVVMNRCTHALVGRDLLPIGELRDRVEEANARLGEHGLRVLAMAARLVDPAEEQQVAAEPMEAVRDLALLGLVGIVDPLRPEAVQSVRIAQAAGIEVRMITGDHLVTAQAIAQELGLGPGGITGRDFAAATDEEVVEHLDALHVFGRVSPEDKLRLVRLLQQGGNVVAMTGDAVNDAAALKQADIGVAMGSGSEVSKQAAKMVLTNDDFSTLVHAIELGRGIFARITAYIGYQMVQLFGLIGMFLLATALNVNSGVALLPLQVLFLNFTLAVVPVVIIALDRPEPGLMNQPPRDPSVRVFNRTTALRWVGLGALLAALSLAPVAFGPDEPATDVATVSVTMGFVVMGLSTALAGFVMRKSGAAAVTAPLVLPAALTAGAGVLVILATEWAPLQRLLLTTDLTGAQWLVCLGLSLTFALAVEAEKAWRRRR